MYVYKGVQFIEHLVSYLYGSILPYPTVEKQVYTITLRILYFLNTTQEAKSSKC